MLKHTRQNFRRLLIPNRQVFARKSYARLFSIAIPSGRGNAKEMVQASSGSHYTLIQEVKSGLPETKPGKPLTVLGIESSCDDTGVAIVQSNGAILSNVVYSQHSIHNKFGGVVPALALQAHKSNIDAAVNEALNKAGLQSLNDIDAVAVTKGPGLEVCLRVGMRKAQQIAREYNKPFVTVHHLEAHGLIARLAGQIISDEQTESISQNNAEFSPKVEFPFLVFLASGGHTSLLLCHGMGQYNLLGGTLDDALGEAFDKAARLIGLEYSTSGGVAIEQMSQLYVTKYQNTSNDPAKTIHCNLPIPMRDKPTCDFSYAGLKTALRLEVEKLRRKLNLDVNASNAPSQTMREIEERVSFPEEISAYLCYIFQDAAFKHVEDKLKKALKFIDRKNIPINALVVVGGVAANLELRNRLLKLIKNYEEGKYNDIHTLENSNNEGKKELKLIFPPVALCTDNGVMSAWAGIEKLQLGISNAIEDQEPIPRWPLGLFLKDRPGIEKK